MILTPDFDAETHTYYWTDGAKPSVTEILNSAGIGHSSTTSSGFEVSEEVMEAARDRGTDVHLACQLLDEGDLDWDTLDDDVLPFVIGYQNWKDKSGFVPDLIEQPLYCADYDYCGTIDRAGWIGEERVIVDLKTGTGGLKPWHAKQLAAYAYPLKRGDEWPLRIVLELKRTTKRGYTPHVLDPATVNWDFMVFLAARTIYADKLGKRISL